MSKKIALVTGASSGIGEATVRQLMVDGVTVYAAARRVERMTSLHQAGAILLDLDVTDDTSMTAAVERIKREAGRLDILVNNAGYGSLGALEDVSIAEARRQLDVNLFGATRLIQLVLPMMREQHSGRIVNISSIGGKIWQPFGGWYHASKFAIEGMSDCLRTELRPFGIDVILIEPGVIKSEWSGIASESLVKASGDTAYGPYARGYAKVITKSYASKLASSPAVVAKVISKALRSRKPKTRYAMGGGAGLLLFINRILSDRGFDRLMWSQVKSAS